LQLRLLRRDADFKLCGGAGSETVREYLPLYWQCEDLMLLEINRDYQEF